MMDLDPTSKTYNIDRISGVKIFKDGKGYNENAYQYATSSYTGEQRMSPALIVYPKTTQEVIWAIRYASVNRVAVAIRTGGHQYSGASSTVAPNIQIDLSQTFRGPEDLHFSIVNGEPCVYASVSWSLGEFSTFLAKHKVFVPHGQCIGVHLGGHVQTGGYGQLGRSFGLLGDHVMSLHIIDYEGVSREITRLSDEEYFFALLGGSPGNLGVVTHMTLKVHRDEDFVGSRGVKSIYWYDTKRLNRLIDILVAMAEDEDFPRNYDLCISVLSSSNKLLAVFPEIDGKMREHHPELYGEDDLPFWPRMIIVYAQWVPFSKDDRPDEAWFDRVREGSLFDLPVKVKPMSELAGSWLFRNEREFDYPYIKSTHVTNSRELSKSGWAKWMTSRIDAIVKPESNRCYLSAQLQCFGGKNSMHYRNRDNGTAFSWRDTTICATLDVFYKESHRSTALDWHRVNEAEAIGAKGVFCHEDRRWLWGSFGQDKDDYDLDQVWRRYFDDEEKYRRIWEVRKREDESGVGTPNTFAVGWGIKRPWRV